MEFGFTVLFHFLSPVLRHCPLTCDILSDLDAMPETTYRNRRAFQVETTTLRLTVLTEGGHIAEILHKPTGMNPLWTPPWPSIEPSGYHPVRHPEFGNNAESKLLAGIMGHNLCLDIFGGPSPEEAAAGLTVHGEGSVVPYAISGDASLVTCRAEFPLAQLRFKREIRLAPESCVIQISEFVQNLSPYDRPVAWTQHVTLGPPFLAKGSTRFRASATRSKTFEGDFGSGDYMAPGAEFDWPHVPCRDGGTSDLRVFTDRPVSGAFTTHLMDPAHKQSFFAAWSPSSRLLFGYVWPRAAFPWLGIWEENYSRVSPPWNAKTLTRGMEFGVSPIPESRRQMIERNTLFGEPTYRWVPALGEVRVNYCAFLTAADAVPERVAWDGEWAIG